MSGGGLDDDYRLYLLDDWAYTLNRENPLLSKQLHDLREVLHAYDYWLAGDYGTEEVEKAWKDYSDKWLSGTPPLEEVVKEIAEGLKSSIIKGWNTDRNGI